MFFFKVVSEMNYSINDLKPVLSLFLFCDDEFELFFEGLSISPDIIICFAPFLWALIEGFCDRLILSRFHVLRVCTSLFLTVGCIVIFSHGW